MSDSNDKDGSAAWPSGDDDAVPQWAAPGSTPQDDAPPPPASASDAPPPPPGYSAPRTAAPPPPGVHQFKPGIIALRPLNFGELLDGAIKAVRHNPKVMVGLNALVALASTVALFAFSFGMFADLFSFDPTAPAPEISGGDIAAFYLGALISSLLLTAITAITAISVGRSVIGVVAPVSEAFIAAMRRFPVVIVMTVLMSLGLLLIMTMAVLVVVVAGTLSPVLGILVGILMVLATLALVAWLSIKLSVAIPAAVLEKLGPIAALQRSWDLTRGRFWMIFAVLLVASIITSVIQQVISAPVSLILPLLAPQNPEAFAGIFVAAIAVSSFVGLLISAVFLAGVTCVVYTDQRMRREGFDLTLSRAAGAQ